LSELTGLSQIKGFGQLSGGDWKQQIDAAISELSKTRIGRGWPGYFDQTCLGKNGKCFKRGQVKFIKKIGAKFTLGKKREDDSHELENLVIFRADPVHGYQETTNAVLPTIVCTEARKP